jgi:hypothetical protein
MKKILFLSILISILISLLSFVSINDKKTNHEQFTYNEKGLSPNYIIVHVDSLNQSELYNQSINWIKEKYKNPDKVLKMTIENEKLRLEGVKTDLICIKAGGINCYNGTYIIELSFKDNKYKFEPIALEYRVPRSQYSAGGVQSIDLNDGSIFYKNGQVQKYWATIPNAIESLFNEINFDLEQYLTKKQIKQVDEDW